MTENDRKYEALVAKIKEQPLLPNLTRELLGAYETFDPTQMLSRCKKTYQEAELDWYRSMDRCIIGHPKIEDNPVWKRCATEDGYVNSNYGWCVYSKRNGEQYKHAVRALIDDPYTRQSVCIYTRPSIQTQHNDGRNAKNDFICTFCSHQFIRDNKLQYIVYMRSNDIDTGLPYDLAWHQFIYHNMITDLRCRKYHDLDYGLIHWHASSLHRYEKDVST